MIDPVNGLFDIPDYENTEDEIFAPLPPPMSPGQEDGEGDPLANGDEGELSKLAEVPVAKRRLVKRPQPKLDSQRLVSEKGLPALRTLFDGVRFKGKGHEGQDLKVLMQKMENWAHRLYPKLQFDDFVDKLETLGSKKEVQTCLKRIRLDMPLTHEDFTGQDGEEGTSGGLRPADEPDPFSQPGFMGNGPAHSTPAGTSLSEEQRQRIELNRRLALERRLARHQEQLNASQLADPGTEDPSGSSGPSHSQGNEDQSLTSYMGDGGECGSAYVVDPSHDMTNGSD